MNGFQATVVVPVHNKRRHIVRCITSVLNQSLAASEVIVVDDASTDGSIDELTGIHPTIPIKIVRRTLPGPGGYAARNAAIKLASYPWVVFIDADDTWLPEHLFGMAVVLSEVNYCADIVFSAYTIVEGERPLVQPRVRLPAAKVLLETDILEQWANGRSPLWTGALAARRQSLLDAGLFPEGRCRRGGDKDLWLRLIAGRRCLYSGRRTANYHIDSENMVTKQVAIEGDPCIGMTVLHAMSTERAQSKRYTLLAAIYLLEVYKYRRIEARSRGRLRLQLPLNVVRARPISATIILAKIVVNWVSVRLLLMAGLGRHTSS